MRQLHLAHYIVDHIPQRQRMTVTDVVGLAQRLLIGEQRAQQRLVEILHTGEIDLVQAVADNGQAALALHLQQTRENTDVTGPGDEARAQGQDFEAELLGAEDFLFGQVLGGPVVIIKASRHLLFMDVLLRTPVEVDRR
ncbi:hypothetical protein D3C80_977690 [compost metagenome]